MNTVRLSLLFFCMIALTNISFAGQVDDEKKEEPECDYISAVKTL